MKSIADKITLSCREWTEKNPTLAITLALLALVGIKYPFLKYPLLAVIGLLMCYGKITTLSILFQKKHLGKPLADKIPQLLSSEQQKTLSYSQLSAKPIEPKVTETIKPVLPAQRADIADINKSLFTQTTNKKETPPQKSSQQNKSQLNIALLPINKPPIEKQSQSEIAKTEPKNKPIEPKATEIIKPALPAQRADIADINKSLFTQTEKKKETPLQKSGRQNKSQLNIALLSINKPLIEKQNQSEIEPQDKPPLKTTPHKVPEEQKQLLIDYIDMGGNCTTREIIICHGKKSQRENCIDAFCFLKNDSRTFRIDRIQQCVDLETGEVINNIPAFIENFFK